MASQQEVANAQPAKADLADIGEEEPSVLELLDEAKRDFALRKWNDAADGYGQILEAVSGDYAEDDPILAPLHHRYGHALLEHAIATSGALGGGGAGKDAPMPSRAGGASGGASTVASARAQDKSAKADQKAEKALAQAIQNQASGSGSSSASAAVAGPATNGSQAPKSNDPRFTFGGDAEESDEEEADPAPAGDGDEEEEDDLGVAFSVLEVARVQYEKVLAQSAAKLKTLDGEEWDTNTLKLQLAEVLNDLADVGLESENFQQASSDYEEALKLLDNLLWPHSRRLADANLRLGLALEFHPDPTKQQTAERFVSSALRTLRQRLQRLEKRQQDIDAGSKETTDASTNAGKYAEKDDVATMDWQAVAKEKRDVEEMVKELEMKVEEYSAVHATAANGASGSAGAVLGAEDPKAALKQAINEALLGASTNGIAGAEGKSAATQGEESSGFSGVKAGAPVNDLSAMVKKKKRPADAVEPSDKGKGKAAASTDTSDKRARVEDVNE